ncbi:hypothetical protein C8J56DRAFT_1053758 [Mycena floridula]|nr:hypothetical protein C8J56DRAFT_1053758 [Mycena floridula]
MTNLQAVAESATRKDCVGTFSSDYLRKPTYTTGARVDQLLNYDTVFIVDDSGSMREEESGKTYWGGRAGRESQRPCWHCAGSVDIHLLNTNIKAIGVKKAERVQGLFAKVQPRAITPIAYRLKLLLQDYLDKLEKLAMTEQHYTLKRINCMIITDGKPSEEPEDAIIAAARRLEKGDFSPGRLEYSLSRSAISGTPKISPVLLRCSAKETRDTIPCYGKLSTDKLVKILVGGIVRREEA